MSYQYKEEKVVTLNLASGPRVPVSSDKSWATNYWSHVDE